MSQSSNSFVLFVCILSWLISVQASIFSFVFFNRPLSCWYGLPSKTFHIFFFIWYQFRPDLLLMSLCHHCCGLRILFLSPHGHHLVQVSLLFSMWLAIWWAQFHLIVAIRWIISSTCVLWRFDSLVFRSLSVIPSNFQAMDHWCTCNLVMVFLFCSHVSAPYVATDNIRLL